MNLLNMISPKTGDIISVIGAGGKTTFINQLSKELDGMRLVTTTTKMFLPSIKDFSIIINDSIEFFLGKIEQPKVQDKPIFFARKIIENNKVEGIPKEWISIIKKTNFFKNILVEADGSKRKSIKIHKTGEPIFPFENNKIIYIIGIDCLGKELNEENFHRINLLIDNYNFKCHKFIDSRDIINTIKITFYNKLISYKQCEKILLINKAESLYLQEKASEIGEEVKIYFDKVCIGSVQQKRWVQL